MSTVIPFHKPFTDSQEHLAMQHVLTAGTLRGDGPASKRVQQLMRTVTGSQHAFFTTSCTHALEIAVQALGIGPGDEVIMPSYTFVSTANAVLMHGGKPVFCDIMPDTLNMDFNHASRLVTARTKAIIPVHYAGVAVDIDAMMKFKSTHGVHIIEDAAQGADAYHQGKHLGTFGDFGCLSFHDTKNITCGEGGALLTNNPELARRAEIIREKGTNRSAFLRGEVDKYTWIDRGSSYIQSDLLAAVLEVQWQKRTQIKELRADAWNQYQRLFEPFEQDGKLKRPVITPGAETNYHTYFVTTTRTEQRDILLEAYKQAGIQASFHYIPLHNSPFGKKLQEGNVPHLPVTEQMSERIIRLPLYPAIAVEHPDFCERVYEITARVLK